MQHFFVNPEAVREKEIIVREEEVVHQMNRVLRMRVGDQCIFLDNSGSEFFAQIVTITSRDVWAHIIEKRLNANEPSCYLTLYQALPKKMDLFEWVLQKGTEIGVSKFVPLITRYTEREVISKEERLKKIIREAAEQSERGRMPDLAEVVRFEKIMAEKKSHPQIILHSRGEHDLLGGISNQLRSEKNIDIFIGPEGGFPEEEVILAQKNGFLIASLGKRILRTETAAIVAAGLLLS